MRLWLCSFLLLLLCASPASAARLEGWWSGTATRGGEQTLVSLHIERTSEGFSARYAIPALSLAGMPLNGLGFDPAAGAISSRAFKGRMEQGRITGELHVAALHGPPVVVQLERKGEPPALATSERTVEFVSRGHRLKGTLVSPSTRGRRPALVSLHGSGPSTRWFALDRARRFAAAGYPMLIFDKPGSGESEGDWTMTSLDEMAADAIAALRFLAAQPEVDSAKVGWWAHSQAGWVVSRASALGGAPAFTIVLAGGGATSRSVEEFGYRNRLRHAGASAAASQAAMGWVERYFDYVRTGQGYAAITDQLKSEAGAEWVKALGVREVYPTPEQQPKWRWVATYDPARDIRTMRMPLLLLFAAEDENSPTEESLRAWREALAAAGNRRVDWRLFADADHHFLVPAGTAGWPRIADGYYETQIAWLRRTVG